MELKIYAKMLWKWAWLIVLATILAGSLSYWNSSRQPRVYQASATIRVGQFLQSTNPNPGDISTSQQLANLYAQTIRRQTLLQATIDALGLDLRWGELAGRVNAYAVAGAQLIQVSALDTNPEMAKEIADELANQLILQSPNAQERAQEQQREFVNNQLAGLQARIEAADAQVEELEVRISNESSAKGLKDAQDQIGFLQQKIQSWQNTYAGLLDFNRGSRTNYLTLADSAVVPTVPIGRNTRDNALLAAAIGFLLASAAALLMEYLDDTLNTEERASEVLGFSILGSIARIDRVRNPGQALVSLRQPHSPIAEAYRVLRTNVRFASINNAPTKLLVTSARLGEGKSTTAANLATTFAQSGKRTVLVDADLRHPTLHTFFSTSREVGLTTLFLDDPVEQATQESQPRPAALEGEITPPALEERLEECLRQTAVPNLLLLPSGPQPPNPSELLGSSRMDEVLQALGRISDLVILDSSPLLPVADTLVLAAKGTAVVLVAEAGRTRPQTARNTKQALLRANARVLGVVLNKVHRKETHYYSYPFQGREEGRGLLSRLFRRQPRGLQGAVAAGRSGDRE